MHCHKPIKDSAIEEEYDKLIGKRTLWNTCKLYELNTHTTHIWIKPESWEVIHKWGLWKETQGIPT